MKKTLVILSSLLLASCYQRIGKLTIISTRNIETSTQYVLIAKDVTAKAKTKKNQALEIAIDKAVKQFPKGEFMKNTILEVSKSGRKIKVIGDVWGTP